ncbi:hypothetical protein [Porphyromonas sp.]|uniref:hypothetical protein n=1 Tax=Porphyromonas sp. TaxID=1924944 RepID=UPI0026DC5804|nr:hypothetical protein [Porphyromonas sp.]MDO4695528.1 hypothetical protein [Porphyromonas sp.]MDO4771672.1 hypothetical protein [Porphyromonas sp.]
MQRNNYKRNNKIVFYEKKELKSILFLFISGIAIGCSKAPEVSFDIQQKNNSQSSDEKAILAFESRQDFTSSFNSHKPETPSKTFSDAAEQGAFFEFRSLRSSQNENISIEELVPDQTLSKMLNSDGEIIIADTLYKINPNGTFFCKLSDKEDLYEYVNSFAKAKENEILVKENLYKHKNAYRFDSYKNFDFYNEETEGYEESPNGLRSETYRKGDYLQDIYVGTFSYRNPKPKNFVSKTWAKLGGRVSNTLTLGKDRRLNCEVFSVDNVFVQTEGITAKYQKKMWYGGWAKFKYIEPGRLRIGFRDVLISNELTVNNPHLPPYIKTDTDDHGTIHKKFVDIVYGRQSGNHMVYTSTPNAELREHYLGEGGISKISYYPWTALVGKDATYEFHPSFWARNEDDESEITFRFSRSIKTIILSFTDLNPYNLKPNKPIDFNTIQGLNNLHKTFVLTTEDPAIKKTLIRGDFYVALEYDGKWRGMFLEWKE